MAEPLGDLAYLLHQHAEFERKVVAPASPPLIDLPLLSKKRKSPTKSPANAGALFIEKGKLMRLDDAGNALAIAVPVATGKKPKAGSKNAAPKMKKDELVALMHHRRLPGTISHNQHKTNPQLLKELGPITENDHAFLEARKEAHKKYKDITSADLRRRLVAGGLSKSSSLTRSYMIDLIELYQLAAPKKLQQDPDQQAFVHRIRAHFNVLGLSAGPGSGKTTTLSAAACMLADTHERTDENGEKFIQKAEDTSILILAFNIGAAEVMEERIILQGNKSCNPRRRLDPWHPPKGITCLTFNKFAYAVIRTQYGKEVADTVPPSFQCSLAVQIFKERPMGQAWTFFLGDEGQDINAQFADFVNVMQKGAKHTIFAGDPRQEVYPGAQFFSNLWTHLPPACKLVLRYNHRSSSQLIRLINDFSRTFFPTLHHDQLVPAYRLEEEKKKAIADANKPPDAAKPAPEGVSFMTCAPGEIGQALAVELMKHHPKTAYVVTPVSVEKYKHGEMLLETRNTLVRRGSPFPFVSLYELAKYRAKDACYQAGSSMKLKGTEKETGFFIGGHILYEQYGIQRVSMLKYYFVCLSRFIKSFQVLLPLNVKVARESPLGLILSHCKGQSFKFMQPPEMERKLLNYVRVKDDLSKSDAIAVTYSQSEGPKLLDSQFQFNADFAGIYVEALMAIRLEDKAQSVTGPWRAILLKPRMNIVNMNYQQVKETRVFHELQLNNEYLLMLKPNEPKNPPAELVRCVQPGASIFDQAYALAVLNFSARIGMWWEASKEVLDTFRNGSQSLEAIVQALPRKLELENQKLLSWGRPVSRPIYCERSGKIGASISGVLDLEFQKLQLEIKFAQASDAHLRQTAIYSDVCGKQGRVCNLLTGSISDVEKSNRSEVDRYSRLWLALKNGLAKSGKRVRIPDISGAILCAIDTETHGFPPHGQLLETGMALWSFGTDVIQGTFSEIADGVIPCDDTEKAFCGLIPQDDGSYSDVKLKQTANDFLNNINGRKVALVYGGCNDVECAGVSGLFEQVIDVRQIYRTYLEQNHCSREGNTKLEDATMHLFGEDFVAEYHTAFEDALSTALLACAIIDFGGTL